MSGEAIVFLIFSVFIGAISCCCCCCATVMTIIIKSISALFRGKTTKKYQSANNQSYHAVNNPVHQYDAEATVIDSSQISQEDVPLVEAFVVHPLRGMQEPIAPEPSAPALPSEIQYGQEHPIEIPNTSFQDKWAAILFYLNLIVLLVFASMGFDYIQKMRTDGDEYNHKETVDSSFNVGFLIIYLLVLCFMVTNAASLLFNIFLWNGERIIHISMYFAMFMTASAAFLSLLSGAFIPSLILFASAAFTYCYYNSILDRIPFAAAVLAIACKAIYDNLIALLLTSYGAIAVQFGYIIVWCFATAPYFIEIHQSRNIADDDRAGQIQSSNILTLTPFFFSLFWGLAVVKDVMIVTCSGAVACWWFFPKHIAPVRSSLFRAVTTSFGSVCFGSLIYAVVHTLHFIVKNLESRTNRRSDNDNNRSNELQRFLLECCRQCALALLRALENIINYVNKYAYGYVAAFGTDYITSGKRVMQLFEHRGWTAIINDDLISRTFAIFVFGIAAFSAFTGALFSAIFAGGESVAVGAILAGVLGLFIGSLFVGLIDTAVAMVFICFAENPSFLETHHPKEHSQLVSAWQQFQPNFSLENNQPHNYELNTVYSDQQSYQDSVSYSENRQHHHHQHQQHQQHYHHHESNAHHNNPPPYAPSAPSFSADVRGDEYYKQQSRSVYNNTHTTPSVPGAYVVRPTHANVNNHTI